VNITMYICVPYIRSYISLKFGEIGFLRSLFHGNLCCNNSLETLRKIKRISYSWGEYISQAGMNHICMNEIRNAQKFCIRKLYGILSFVRRMRLLDD
jgi:acetylglutamate synthase